MGWNTPMEIIQSNVIKMRLVREEGSDIEYRE
jgi:hypothetical protein